MLEEISAARLAPPGEVIVAEEGIVGQAGTFVGIGGSLRRGGGENHEPDKQGEQSAQERPAFHWLVG